MISDEQKTFFAEQAAMRKANGVRLGRWSWMGPSETIAALYDMWEEWIELLGKDKAVKFFFHAMMCWTEALRAAKKEQDEERAKERRK